MNSFISKEAVKSAVVDSLRNLFRKTVDNATDVEIYEAAVYALRTVFTEKWIKTHDEYKEKDVKMVYYLSMEFLMGRFFGNSVMNLLMYDTVKEALEELGLDYNTLENTEQDPGLGNGGLGRLAACFLDSLSTMEYPAYGCGIRYHYGIFEQQIDNGYQVERPDNWLANGDFWSIKRSEYEVEVKFAACPARPVSIRYRSRRIPLGLAITILRVLFPFPVIVSLYRFFSLKKSLTLRSQISCVLAPLAYIRFKRTWSRNPRRFSGSGSQSRTDTSLRVKIVLG